MGHNQSKARLETLEREQQQLKRQNTELLKRLEAKKDNTDKHYEASFDRIAALLSKFSKSKLYEEVLSNERVEIKIGNTTYEILQYVSKGGFGKVYKAKVAHTDHIVAVKELIYEADVEAEIQREIKILRLTKRISIDNHPIIEYYGSKRINGFVIIAMEFAICDLYTFWKNNTFRETTEDITIPGMIIIIYVLRALAFLERISIIHGDIKPHNIVFVPNEPYFSIKLIDFGAVEKLNTMRSQITVDEDKVHSLYFASPEFMRYDSRNRISRRLHKTSDAWAAGVMFYQLFCDKLPWKTEDEYRNFCNDPNAEDIAVPISGEYRMIIELLLKKNPEKRSSAKATLIQLKAHPTFGKIVELLHKKFSPVDDVCDVVVPDEIRQELSKLISRVISSLWRISGFQFKNYSHCSLGLLLYCVFDRV